MNVSEPKINDSAPGLLINVTGNGKGKSTSAFGMAVRSLGWGKKTAILQFMKGSDYETGELNFFRHLDSPLLIYELFGAGRFASSDIQKNCAEQGFARMKELLHLNDLNLLILDELNVVLYRNFLPLNDVIRELLGRRPQLHVCITGRHAPEEILKISDLVSCIDEVRHPYQFGIPAQKGIDF